MTAALFNPRALLAESQLGVLTTIKKDGRPQLSPVMPYYDQQVVEAVNDTGEVTRTLAPETT